MTTPCGGYYLGVPGNLIRIDGSHGGLSRQWSPKVTVHDGGLGKSYAQAGAGRPPRSWRIELEACTPAEIAGLREVLMSAPAALTLVEPDAQVRNALGPEASLWTGHDVIGGYDLAEGGRAYRAVANHEDASAGPAMRLAGIAPVVPGRPVTASSYVASRYGGRIDLWWYDSDGQPTPAATSPTAPNDIARLHRVAATATAPSWAVGAGVIAVHCEYMARAAVTWTSQVTQWDAGLTAMRCVIPDAGDTVYSAVPDVPGMIRSGHSITLVEVGV